METPFKNDMFALIWQAFKKYTRKKSVSVFGRLSFKCDYFDLDQLAYNIRHPAESED